MPMAEIPLDVPEDLHHLAACLSWEDAINLLCLYEGWAIDKHNTLETRVRVLNWADEMLVLARALPYDWATICWSDWRLFSLLLS